MIYEKWEARLRTKLLDPTEVDELLGDILMLEKTEEKDDFKEYWNERCNKLHKIEKLTDTRKRAKKARIKEYGKDKFYETVNKAFNLNFLNGTSGDWVANVDFVLSPRGFTKIAEGFYDRFGFLEVKSDLIVPIKEGSNFEKFKSILLNGLPIDENNFSEFTRIEYLKAKKGYDEYITRLKEKINKTQLESKIIERSKNYE